MVYLDSDTQSDLVYDGAVLQQEGHGERRWSEAMSTVVRHDDGKLYRIDWDRGLTENQEDSFDSGEVPEVFAVDSLEVRSTVLYLTEEEQKTVRPTLAQKLVAESASYAIATGKDIREPVTEELYEISKALRELIPSLAPLDVAADSGAYRKAAEQYLDSIIALWEGKN